MCHHDWHFWTAENDRYFEYCWKCQSWRSCSLVQGEVIASRTATEQEPEIQPQQDQVPALPRPANQANQQPSTNGTQA